MKRKENGVMRIISCAAACFALGAGTAWAQTPTPIEEVVIYGIDGQTDEMLRYTFDTDTYQVIGVVQTASGEIAYDTENLTWVPSGPAKGMYASPRGSGPLEGYLIKINPFDGSCEALLDTRPWKDINGMVTLWKDGKWQILCSDYNDQELIWIDPETLTMTYAMSYSVEIEGLAADGSGNVYGNTDEALYAIDLVAETVTLIGDCGTGKMESLEMGFGDNTPEMQISGIPAAWTVDGVLMGFDDSEDELMIIDPATGNAQAYAPCAFAAADCEGIVVLTNLQDPSTVVLDPAGD
jgi:hypothetical protein